jgi:hypothetical protein
MKFMHFWLKCIWLDWWKFIHFWLKCIWLDDKILAVLVQMLYSWMIKSICFFLEMYIVGRRTPHTSFYLNKAKKYTWKKGRKKGVGGGGFGGDKNSTTLYHKRS